VIVPTMRESRDKLRAGSAKKEITPAVGTPLSGFIARLGVSTRTADRLYTRALVLSDGKATFVLVQLDLLAVGSWHVQAIRDLCEARWKIPAASVLIAATHTHSGPGMVAVRGCLLSPLDYQWSIVHRTLEAIREAHAALSPARIFSSRIPFRLGVNRRQMTETGITLGVDMRKPAPQFLDILKITVRHGKSCVVFSHAAHPYILGGDQRLISGDFPSAACQALERSRKTVAIFLNGCAGDIAPLRAFEGYAAVREEGSRMAEAVLAVSGNARELRSTPLGAAHERVCLPFRKLPTFDQLRAMKTEHESTVRPAERTNPGVAEKIRSAIDDWATSLERVIQGTSSLDPVFAEVQILRIGDFCLVGLSGEPFFSLGELIRKSGRARVTWVAGYCNAYSGYLPTARAFDEGGYEVSDSYRYLGIWQIDRSSAGRVVRRARELMKTVYEK